MATTTNFGWETPDDTDLVKDGAAAMRTLGNSIDTSFVDLKGGTSGQMLTKASNTDLDYTWVTPEIGDITAITASSPLTGGGTTGAVTVGILDGTTSNKGAVQLSTSTSSTSTSLAATASAVKSAYDLADAAIPKSLIDAAGDLIVGTAADTAGRLAIGTAGQVLKVNSGATALEWGTAASASGVTLITRTTFSGVSSQIFDGVFTSTYKSYLIIVEKISSGSSGDDLQMQFRVGSTTLTSGYYCASASSNSSSSTQFIGNNSDTFMSITPNIGTSSAPQSCTIWANNVGNTAEMPFIRGNGYNANAAQQTVFGGSHSSTSNTVTGFLFKSENGSNVAGTVSIYGMAAA
jgi:hypothetical protein